MSPIYLNPQPSSSIPFIELKGDNINNQQQNTFQVFSYLHGDHLETSTNNSFSYNSHNRLNSEEMFSLDYARHDEVKVEKLVLSSDLGQPNSPWLQSTNGDENSGSSYAYSINNLQKDQTIQNVNNNDQNKYSKKWKSSKVKIMQKMMTRTKNSREGSKQQQLDHDQPKRQSSDVIRTCTDCHTTTTPLWRSGPQGPKSLCNACGIRQRKARRAAMAAAAAAAAAAATTDYLNDAIVPSLSHVEAPKTKVQVTKSEKVVFDHDKNRTLPIKKRSKIIHASKNENNYNNNYTNNSHNNSKNICFEDFTLSSNKDHFKANTKRSFPRDEEEGAILLMALSCGLACSSY